MRFLRVALLLGSIVTALPSTSLAITTSPTTSSSPSSAKPPAPRPAVRVAARSVSALGTAVRSVSAPGTAASSPVQALRAKKPMLAITAKAVGVPSFWPPMEHADTKALITNGKQLMMRQEVRAQKLLSTSGFHSLDDIAKAVSAMGPSRKEAVELLRKENGFEIKMRTPGTIREAIAQKGFLNQHDTGCSRGCLNPNYRSNVEAAFLGISREDYDKLPNSVRPKYGYMAPSKASGIGHDNSASHYGEDVFVFKNEIKQHVTFHPTDSLGGSTANYGTSGSGKAPDPTVWHQILQPWSQRMLLAPSIDVSADKKLQMGASGPSQWNGKYSGSYLEIQIWRPVTLKDVARFEFTNTPPSGSFLKALRDSGVKIYKSGDNNEWKDDQQHTSLFELPRANFTVSLAA